MASPLEGTIKPKGLRNRGRTVPVKPRDPSPPPGFPPSPPIFQPPVTPATLSPPKVEKTSGGGGERGDVGDGKDGRETEKVLRDYEEKSKVDSVPKITSSINLPSHETVHPASLKLPFSMGRKLPKFPEIRPVSIAISLNNIQKLVDLLWIPLQSKQKSESSSAWQFLFAIDYSNQNFLLHLCEYLSNNPQTLNFLQKTESIQEFLKSCWNSEFSKRKLILGSFVNVASSSTWLDIGFLSAIFDLLLVLGEQLEMMKETERERISAIAKKQIFSCLSDAALHIVNIVLTQVISNTENSDGTFWWRLKRLLVSDPFSVNVIDNVSSLQVVSPKIIGRKETGRFHYGKLDLFLQSPKSSLDFFCPMQETWPSSKQDIQKSLNPIGNIYVGPSTKISVDGMSWILSLQREYPELQFIVFLPDEPTSVPGSTLSESSSFTWSWANSCKLGSSEKERQSDVKDCITSPNSIIYKLSLSSLEVPLVKISDILFHVPPPTPPKAKTSGGGGRVGEKEVKMFQEFLKREYPEFVKFKKEIEDRVAKDYEEWRDRMRDVAQRYKEHFESTSTSISPGSPEVYVDARGGAVAFDLMKEFIEEPNLELPKILLEPPADTKSLDPYTKFLLSKRRSSAKTTTTTTSGGWWEKTKAVGAALVNKFQAPTIPAEYESRKLVDYCLYFVRNYLFEEETTSLEAADHLLQHDWSLLLSHLNLLVDPFILSYLHVQVADYLIRQQPPEGVAKTSGGRGSRVRGTKKVKEKDKTQSSKLLMDFRQQVTFEEIPSSKRVFVFWGPDYLMHRFSRALERLDAITLHSDSFRSKYGFGPKQKEQNPSVSCSLVSDLPLSFSELKQTLDLMAERTPVSQPSSSIHYYG